VKSLRPLKSLINRVLFAVILLAFVVTATFVGGLQYVEGQKEVVRILAAQSKIAESLIPDLLLAHDNRFEGVARNLAGLDEQAVLAKIRSESRQRDPFDVSYVLDRDGRIIQISEEYTNYLGFNPSHMDHIKGERKVSRVFQSVFSKRPVVALKYRLNKNLQLIYERDVSNILPALLHLEKGKILPEQALILLTSEGIVVYHPDQSLVKTRHNLAFDMKNFHGPNSRGLYSYEYQQHRYYAVQENLEAPKGWVLYLQVPARPLLVAAAKGIGLQLLEMLLLFLAVTFAIQFMLNRFFSKPVGAIVEALAGYQPGDSKHVLVPQETGVLEFARIAGAINRMAADVSQATERFLTLVDSLDALVYVADMETYELLFVNEYGRKIWGDIAGKICWQTLQEGQSGPCPFCTNHLLLDEAGQPAGTHVWQFQNTVTKDWFECRDQAIQWAGGRLVRMEIAINITFRKEAEDRLAAEKERLAVTLRSIGDGVITTDTQGKIILINRVAEALTGWTQAEAEGRDLVEVFSIINGTTRDVCESPLEKVIATGEIGGLAHNTVLIAKDGQERSIADSGAPIRDRNSEIIGVVLVFRDETETLRLQEESVKAKKLESVGVLAGGIAHDFNNILTAILGNISMALMDTGVSDKTRELLGGAEKASVRAKHLTQQLLTFAKGGEPVKQSASIANVIKDSANFVLHGSNVSCSYDIPENLWLVDIDQGQMSQVVQNLIINAKEAMAGGGEIQVTCDNVPPGTEPQAAPDQEGRYVRVRIQDNGPGMSAEIVSKIFDPYFTTKETGSGLGLAICHSIVTKHGGAISVDSLPQAGTVFTLYLPLSQSTAVQEVEEEVMLKPKAACVMIMDDDEMIRRVAATMLEMEGHEVVLAKNGEEAITLYLERFASAKPVDLVIMDLTIPGGMGGKEAVSEILAVNPRAKVIVSSGYSNDPIMANPQHFGFVAALVKPIRLLPFQKIINQVLSQS
jgi:PAS domain S-box-containing protein